MKDHPRDPQIFQIPPIKVDDQIAIDYQLFCLSSKDDSINL